jgi:broad specificity phosphatase PhoE
MRGPEILLLRHGQSEGNEDGRFGGHGPTPLTAKGRAQAEATARVLASEGGLSAIFCSDLARAVQTAEPICAATGIAMKQTAALRERSVGEMTGLTFAEAEARFPEAYAQLMGRVPDSCPPGGETHRAAQTRAVELLDAILARFTTGRVLMVSHSATLYLMLLHILGVDHATHASRFFIRTDNCALHRLRRAPTGIWTVFALNDRSHLASV